ncbi:MAG: cation:proton antiporter [Candidatus Zixiibacteriota bacterium]
MSESMLLGLASIVVLGIVAQWIAWRLHLPSILLLLIGGFIAGPITGILRPDDLFGGLLFPLVSISVAIILFEGGLSLELRELRQVGKIVISLTTTGIFVTWVLASLAAHLVVGIQWVPAILLGAILVVSGPTVIIPLLRHIRPAGNIGSIIKWEGIINDPIGAILAVLVFEVTIAGGFQAGTSTVVFGVIKAIVAGSAIGFMGAVLMVLLLKRYFIPDFLQNPVSLMVVIMAYTAANALQHEAGLLAVTIMGIALANQKYVSIRHIVEFKENLRVLLISSLFIILAARLPLSELGFDNIHYWIFVAILILVIRPAMVFVSTRKAELKMQEKIFLSWVAPRGIVAAAVASVFAIRLAEHGYPHCDILAPLTFMVIIVTVAFYGLTAPYAARQLKVAKPNPQGILFAGAQPWIRDLAKILNEEGFQTVLIDTNWGNITAARNAGLNAHYSNVLSENLHTDLVLDGIGRLLALTPNDEVNSLAALHFQDIFGSSEVYQLSARVSQAKKGKGAMPLHLHGRFLFSKEATYDYLLKRLQSEAIVKKTRLTEEFDFSAVKRMYGATVLPMMVINKAGNLRIYTADYEPSPEAGETLISIVDRVPDDKKPDRE